MAALIRTWRLLLGVALLAGLVASCDTDPNDPTYIISTLYDGPEARDGHTDIGTLYVGTGQLAIYLSRLSRYAGPVTEAFIVDKVQPNPDGTPVLSFPGHRPSDLLAHLSKAQMRQMLAGDYALVVRTSSIEAGQVVGQPRSWPQDVVEMRKDQGYVVRWSVPDRDANGGQPNIFYNDDTFHPFTEFFHSVRSGDLCFDFDSRYDAAKRQVAAFRISILGGKAAPLTFTFGPDTFKAQACMPSSRAITAALAAGRVQVTISTAPVPAGEFVGRLVLKPAPRPSVARPLL